MVEDAIVLVAWYYGNRDKGAGYDNVVAGKLILKHIVTQLWNQIAGNAKSGVGCQKLKLFQFVYSTSFSFVNQYRRCFYD